MSKENGHEEIGITEDYEQRALNAFKIWYQQTKPTISDAATQAYIIARDTVRGLTTTQVILLLQEHSEWTHEEPQETFDSDKKGGLTIGEIARRHFVKCLQKTIQKRGLEAACTDRAVPGRYIPGKGSL